MRGQAVNIVLAAALVVSLAAHWYVRQPAVHPNLEYMPTMVRGPAYESYESNPNFADRLTQRPPVAGTIARDAMPLGYAATPADAVRAGNELTNPFSASDAEALARGRLTYERYCVPCHGVTGVGDGPIVARGFRRPPTLLRAFTRSMKDGQLFHIVTFGRGAMPGHAAQIPVDDRWKALLHVRALQSAAPQPGLPSPSAE
jgi:mono/diheme cytochrome c family protein